MKHIAWDYGAIDKGISEVIPGYQSTQKTTKTLCKKKVSMSKIDNENPTCKDCILSEQQEIQAMERILRDGFPLKKTREE